jgi:hypothetical protein
MTLLTVCFGSAVFLFFFRPVPAMVFFFLVFPTLRQNVSPYVDVFYRAAGSEGSASIRRIPVFSAGVFRKICRERRYCPCGNC